jgi:hypothetical protein
MQRFQGKIKISDAKDEHGNPKREEYYLSGAPSRAIEEHKDTVKRLYEVSLCALSADDNCFEEGVYSKMWIDFLQLETVDRDRLAGLDDRSLPLRDHDVRDRMRAYEGVERDKSSRQMS